MSERFRTGARICLAVIALALVGLAWGQDGRPGQRALGSIEGRGAGDAIGREAACNRSATRMLTLHSYLGNSWQMGVAAHRLDGRGIPRERAGFASITNEVGAMALSADGKSVYVARSNQRFWPAEQRMVSQYQVHPGGLSTHQMSSADAAIEGYLAVPTELTLDPLGRFLYVVSRFHAMGSREEWDATEDGQVARYALDAANGGRLAPLETPMNIDTRSVSQIAFHPKGGFAYFLSVKDASIRAYSVSRDGVFAPTPNSVVSLPVADILLAAWGIWLARDNEFARESRILMDPLGRFVFLKTPGNIVAFRIQADGSLARLPGSSGAPMTGRQAAAEWTQWAVDPRGRGLVVASQELGAPRYGYAWLHPVSIGADGRLSQDQYGAHPIEAASPVGPIAIDATGCFIHALIPAEDKVATYYAMSYEGFGRPVAWMPLDPYPTRVIFLGQQSGLGNEMGARSGH